MPIISDGVGIGGRPKLGGGGPGKTPHRRGFGGGDDGDHQPQDFNSHGQRMRRYRIAMALCFVSVTAVFVVLIFLYVLRLGSSGRYDQDLHHYVQDWIPLKLPYLQLWINSAVLLMSSGTLELARRSMAKKQEFAAMGIVPPLKRNIPWLGITLLLGFAFLAGQLLVWQNLSHQGVYHITNPSRFYFYLLTGAHAAHLAGGLLALLYAAAGRLLMLRFQSQLMAVEVTSWYWHYLAFLWFGIFALVHFARG